MRKLLIVIDVLLLSMLTACAADSAPIDKDDPFGFRGPVAGASERPAIAPRDVGVKTESLVITTFINSNNGAALNNSSNKLNCLRGVMMLTNPSTNHEWDCSGDNCFFHGSSVVAGHPYACADTGFGTQRRCKLDTVHLGTGTNQHTWMFYHQTGNNAEVTQCDVCPHSGTCNVDGFGNPKVRVIYTIHRAEQFP